MLTGLARSNPEMRRHPWVPVLISLLLLPTLAGPTEAETVTSQPVGEQVGFGASAGGGAAGTFVFDCFGVDKYTQPAGSGCAAAAAFAASASVSYWFWTFYVSVAVAACGGGGHATVAVSPSAACYGEVAIGNGDEQKRYAFDCQATGALVALGEFYGCVGVSVAVGTADCGSGRATGAVSGISGAQTRSVSAGAASGGCNAVDVALHLVETVKGADVRTVTAQDVDPEVREALKQDLLDSIDAAWGDLVSTNPEFEDADSSAILSPLRDSMRRSIMESVESITFDSVAVFSRSE